MKIYQLHLLPFLLFTLILTSFIFPEDVQDKDCSIFKSGTFRYIGIPDKSAHFIIKGNKHIEYHQDKKYWIKSDLVWLDDCTYEVTMTKLRYPNFPFQPGAKMQVELLEVIGKVIKYKCTVGGESWEGSVEKVDE